MCQTNIIPMSRWGCYWLPARETHRGQVTMWWVLSWEIAVFFRDDTQLKLKAISFGISCQLKLVLYSFSSFEPSSNRGWMTQYITIHEETIPQFFKRNFIHDMQAGVALFKAETICCNGDTGRLCLSRKINSWSWLDFPPVLFSAAVCEYAVTSLLISLTQL